MPCRVVITCFGVCAAFGVAAAAPPVAVTKARPQARAADSAPFQVTNWFSLGNAAVDPAPGSSKLALNVARRRDTANDITVYDRRRSERGGEIESGDGAYRPSQSDAAQSLLPGPQWHSDSEQQMMTGLHDALGIGMGRF